MASEERRIAGVDDEDAHGRSGEDVTVGPVTTRSPGQRLTTRSASFIGTLTLAGRVLERFGAFGQILLIAAFFGATTDADLYFIASIVPLTVGGIVGESLHVSVLPSLASRPDDEIEDLVRAGFWASLTVLAAATLAYVAVVAVVVEVAVPAGSSDLGPWLAFAPIGILLGLGSYVAAVLLRLEKYVWPPFRSAAATVVSLALTGLAIWLTDGVVWVALAVTAGYALAFVLLLAELVSTAGRGAVALPSKAALREVLGLWRRFATSLVGGVLGGQVFVLIERALAASLGVGAVSAISYARGVAFTPGVIAQSIALGIYPGMLRAHAARDLAYLRGNYVAALRVTLFVAVSTAAYLALYSASIAAFLFDRGSLDSNSLLEIHRALAAFSLGVVGSMLMIFTARIFSAIDHFRGIVVAQAFALALFVPLALLLRPALGPAGLALAFGIAEVSGGLLGLRMSARRLELPASTLVREVALPAIARAAVVAAALAAFRHGVDPGSAAVEALGGLTVGGVAALVLLWTSGWPEVSVLGRAARRLRP
jgi:putative peptidoglycan lipid II flippase